MLNRTATGSELGNADEQTEGWYRRSLGSRADNPVGGWYGLKKGLRGRFANCGAGSRARPRRSSTTRAITASAPADQGASTASYLGSCFRGEFIYEAGCRRRSSEPALVLRRSGRAAVITWSRYGIRKPIPSAAMSETEVGSALQQLMTDFVHCGIECSPETGRSAPYSP